jgi:7,8-dihydropterin-6-yl-methyl-4-(beta-D-ribofuranosyl)aminobenzene 5'-phosphate synthase
VVVLWVATALAREVKTVRLTVVFDNNRVVAGTQTGWGFACWVELPDGNLLFDTGSKGEVLLQNMRVLGLDPARLGTVVISHMHWDHTGGLKALLDANPHLTVYLPSSATRGEIAELEKAGATVRTIRGREEILPGVWSTGTLGGAIPEQSLVIRTIQGLLVLTGCAHPGIVQILQTVKKQFPGERLELVMGGFHLWSRPENEVQAIVEQFRELGVVHPAPCHCSGDVARRLFHEAFGASYYPAGVGFRAEYRPAVGE